MGIEGSEENAQGRDEVINLRQMMLLTPSAQMAIPSTAARPAQPASPRKCPRRQCPRTFAQAGLPASCASR
jgi:hypothetical protein